MVVFYGKLVGKYTVRPMDAMGIEPKQLIAEASNGDFTFLGWFLKMKG